MAYMNIVGQLRNLGAGSMGATWGVFELEYKYKEVYFGILESTVSFMQFTKVRP